MRKIAIILSLLLFALINAHSEEDYHSYIINDPDGYLNVREKPTANSRIVDKIEQYEVFFDARYFCVYDIMRDNQQCSAIGQRETETVG